VDLETCIVAAYVWIDDARAAWVADVGPLRSRGPAPTLADSEVLTMEMMGEFLGLDCDSATLAYFRRHHLGLFPRLAGIHRTTFARQASNLWAAKEALWHRAVAEVPCDPGLAIVDSIPVPVCRLAHAKRCRRTRRVPARRRPSGGIRVGAAASPGCGPTCGSPGRALSPPSAPRPRIDPIWR
jgi:hypothetical protein